MTPGATHPANSIVSIPVLFNRGNAPLHLPVNYPLTL
jgi:hypothetical protein